MLTGHRSEIKGIIRLNNREIVSGELNGDLRIWNIDQGLCIRHIPRVRADVVVSYRDKVKLWGAANNWGENPIKQFNNICNGRSIEFLSGNLLLTGGYKGQFEFIDYAQTGCELPPIIMGLHSLYINAIQRIAKNIVVTASKDGYLKVIHPIFRRCYLKFKARISLSALAYFY